MNKLLYEMLKSSAESDKSKALLSLELLGEKELLVLVTTLLKISTKILKTFGFVSIR